MTLLFAALLSALVVFLLVMGISGLFFSARADAEERTRIRLNDLLREKGNELSPVLLARANYSQVPWFDRLLERIRWAANIRHMVEMGKAPGNPGTYMLICGLLWLTGFYLVFVFTGMISGALAVAWGLASLPIIWLKRRVTKRMERFNEQLPEALDLLARALKAGHTFGSGMRMVGDEFPEPIGPEFRTTIDEINYGMDTDRALNNLLERVDCPDLKFFAVSVNIQRETGGNLAEIVANIAKLIRQRFELFGKIGVLSAEGRLSAMILSALPFIVTGILWIINPGYMSLLWTHPLGRTMAIGSLVSMSIGIYMIKRMVKIEV